MLKLEQLSLTQGEFRLSADWSAQAAGIVALLGPSGAGKSTLLSVIAGFLAPRSGRVLWNDVDITPLDPGSRPVSMLFQDNNLFPHLTVTQNVALGRTQGLRMSKDDLSAAEQQLSRVGLEGYGARKPGALSGGQQSRAALARILMQEKPLVLLDEPFAALGPALKEEMLDLVAAVLADKLILMVTHDPNDARRSADRVSVVANGLASEPRDVRRVFNDPPPALREYLGS